MKPDCRQFRARLAEALRADPDAQTPAIGELQWHGHVVHCEACQSLLAEEEALEELLRSLPQPHLPRALAVAFLGAAFAAGSRSCPRSWSHWSSPSSRSPVSAR